MDGCEPVLADKNERLPRDYNMGASMNSVSQNKYYCLISRIMKYVRIRFSNGSFYTLTCGGRVGYVC